MNISCKRSSDIVTKKIIYKANRCAINLKNEVTKVKFDNFEKDKQKNEDTPKDSSPTPIKCVASKLAKVENKEFIDLTSTQEIFQDTDTYKTYGKRHRNELEIRETKKFKTSEGGFTHKVIYVYDNEEKCVIGFNCFLEEDMKRKDLPEDVNQEEDDCPTSLTQINYCKDFLEKELEDAIMNA